MLKDVTAPTASRCLGVALLCFQDTARLSIEGNCIAVRGEADAQYAFLLMPALR